MNRTIRLCLLTTLLLCPTQPIAQQPPREIKHLADVEIGMPRETVLVSLRKEYKLSETIESFAGESYIVSTRPPDQPAVVGEVVFVDGVVRLVFIAQAPPAYGEAVTLMRNLFPVFRSETELTTDFRGIHQERVATAKVTVIEQRLSDVNTEAILISFDGGRTIRIKTERIRGFPESVQVDWVKR